MDVSKRGTELVLAEMCETLSQRLAQIADRYRESPDKSGLTRHAESFEYVSTTANQIASLGSAYIAAERINGRT